jgi:hypothetical protein
VIAQDANQTDGVVRGAEFGELKDALLGDDRADQEVDQQDDGHAPQPIHLEVIHHGRPAPSPRRRSEAQEHHNDFAEIVHDVEEIGAGVVDRLADRREQRDGMRRGHARGFLGRVVARFLDQEVVLRLLAAIGNTGAGGRQFSFGAIDEPRAGGVHALKAGEIEDDAFRVFGE